MASTPVAQESNSTWFAKRVSCHPLITLPYTLSRFPYALRAIACDCSTGSPYVFSMLRLYTVNRFRVERRYTGGAKCIRRAPVAAPVTLTVPLKSLLPAILAGIFRLIVTVFPSAVYIDIDIKWAVIDDVR